MTGDGGRGWGRLLNFHLKKKHPGRSWVFQAIISIHINSDFHQFIQFIFQWKRYIYIYFTKKRQFDQYWFLNKLAQFVFVMTNRSTLRV